MPSSEETTIPCPQCQQPVTLTLWHLLDLGREPELRRRFLRGEINVLRCGNCGANGMLDQSLVIHDPANEQIIFFISNNSLTSLDIPKKVRNGFKFRVG